METTKRSVLSGAEDERMDEQKDYRDFHCSGYSVQYYNDDTSHVGPNLQNLHY